MQATQTVSAEFAAIERMRLVDMDHNKIAVLPPPGAVEFKPAVITPADLLRIAMERNDGDLDRLERLMTMDRQWRAEKAREAFNEDFARFKGLNIVIPKTKKVQQRSKSGGAGPSYMQTEFETVATMLQPALSKCGFGYRFDVKFERGENGASPWCFVTCLLEHRLGHVERLTLGGPPDDSGAKNPLQEMQSTSTFLMRHSLLSITGTAQAGKDNDGRGARGYREDDGDEGGGVAPQDPSDELLQAGRDAALLGIEPLNKWWASLTGKQRNDMQKEFGTLRRGAMDATNRSAKQ
jgi:hypothetical protein